MVSHEHRAREPLSSHPLTAERPSTQKPRPSEAALWVCPLLSHLQGPESLEILGEGLQLLQEWA